MKSYALLFVFSFLFSDYAFSQKELASIALDKKEEIKSYKNLGENGFIIKTGKAKLYSKNLDWKLRYYTADLQKVWEVPIETNQMEKGFGQDIIATPNGKYVYHIENMGYNLTWGVSNSAVTQITKEGQVRSYNIEKDSHKEMKGENLAQFCDDHNLYYLNYSTEEYPHQILINKFNHDDFTFSQVKGDLPDNSEQKSSAWEYLSHDEEEIHLISKKFNKKEASYTFYLATYNYSGVLLNESEIVSNLDGKFQTSAINYRYHTGVNQPQNTELRSKDQSIIINNPGSGTSSRMNRTAKYLSEEGYAHLMLDNQNKSIYVYGLYKLKRSDLFSDDIEGFYIESFSINGEKIWSYSSNNTDQIYVDKYFREKLPHYERSTMIRKMNDDKICLQLASTEKIYTYEFDTKGTLVKSYNNEFRELVSYNSFFLTFDETKIKKYFKDHYSKKYEYYGHSSSYGDVLISSRESKQLTISQWVK